MSKPILKLERLASFQSVQRTDRLIYEWQDKDAPQRGRTSVWSKVVPNAMRQGRIPKAEGTNQRCGKMEQAILYLRISDEGFHQLKQVMMASTVHGINSEILKVAEWN